MGIKRLCAVFFACTMIVGAFGCSYKENYHDSNSDYGSKRAISEGKQAKTYGYTRAPDANSHQNEKIFVSEQAMYDVMRVQGVESAVVVISNNNAYVGVTTDNSATGTFGKDNIPGTGGDAHEPRWSANAYDQQPMVQRDALVIDTNNRFTVRKGRRPAPKLQQNITNAVRQMHPHVKQVFISSDPDFVNAMNSYARDYWLGTSLDQRLDEFNRMVNNVFHPAEESIHP